MVNKEFERRFLFDPKKVDASLVRKEQQILQGYLNPYNPDYVTRVRLIRKEERGITLTKAELCMKFKILESKFGDYEVETVVTVGQAEFLMARAAFSLSKTRYTLNIGGVEWELDRFEGPILGEICIAEIELPSPDTEIVIPDFILAEITGEKALSNFRIAQHPNVAETTAKYILNSKKSV